MLEFKEFNLTYKNGKVLSLSHNKKINVQTLNINPNGLKIISLKIHLNFS